jgi:hypothetical protein
VLSERFDSLLHDRGVSILNTTPFSGTKKCFTAWRRPASATPTITWTARRIVFPFYLRTNYDLPIFGLNIFRSDLLVCSERMSVTLGLITRVGCFILGLNNSRDMSKLVYLLCFGGWNKCLACSGLRQSHLVWVLVI